MKLITWDTNFNGKLDCNMFVHVDVAPAVLPSERAMADTIFQIQVSDNSHEPVQAKVVCIAPFRVAEILNMQTWPSHGMYTADLLTYLYTRKKVRITPDTMLAVYYYSKVI